MRRRLAVLLVLAAVTACGDSSASTSGVAVQFIGNSTCDTNGQQPYSPSPPNVNSSPPIGQPVNEMPHIHVAPGTKITYDHNPPTSGCHFSLGNGVAPISPGVYPADTATKQPPEYWLHNLEHGYIAVTYNCPTGCESDLVALNAWYHKLLPDPAGYVAYAKFIAVPYTAQKERWAVISWDWYDPMGSTLNLSEVQKFYDNHVNQAPESPASG